MVTARELAKLFYTAENGNVCIWDDHTHAQTVRDMVFSADSAGLGWDFAYEAVRDCLQHLDDTDSTPFEDFDPDSLLDVYTSNLVAWLAQAPHKHVPLCDEIAEELDLGADVFMEDRIRWGQERGYRYAMDAIAQHWPDNDDDSDDDGADDD